MKLYNTNLNCSVSDITYHINEKKQTVTCVLTYRIRTSLTNEFIIMSVNNKFYQSKQYIAVGVSYLTPGDEFDVEIGKKIARARAESEMYKNTGEYIQKIMNKVNNEFMNSAMGFLEKCANIIEHNEDYISQF